MDREELITLAARHVCAFSPAASAYGDNRSLFGIMRAVIACTENEDPIRCLPIATGGAQHRFCGVKLPELINALNILLPPETQKLFANRDEMLAYVEVCRRLFVSKPAAAPDTASIPALPPPKEPEPKACEAPDYRKCTMFQLTLLVQNIQDKKCAEYILANPGLFKDRKLIEKAREILALPPEKIGQTT